MALTRFSALINDARGSIGGLALQGTPAGVSLRPRKKPRNPNSPAQQAHRSYVALARALWAMLSTESIESWASAAPPRISGYNHFLATNLYRIHAGQFPLFDPPPVGPAVTGPVLSGGGGLAATQELLLNIAAPLEWTAVDGMILLAHIYPLQTATQRTARGTPRLAVVALGSADDPPGIPFHVPTPVGTLKAGHRCWVEVFAALPDGRVTTRSSRRLSVT